MTEQFSKKNEAWSARFSEPVSDLVKRYTASVFFDHRLAHVDIQGSLAHAEMLAHQKIITSQDYADIQRGMQQILEEINSGKFEWLLDHCVNGRCANVYLHRQPIRLNAFLY